MPKIAILIEDDWELRGDGGGDVAAHQYVPARFLMDQAESLGIRVSFMVEVMQQLTFESWGETIPSFRSQAGVWRESVVEMIQRGFDVQLHTQLWKDQTFTRPAGFLVELSHQIGQQRSHALRGNVVDDQPRPQQQHH